MLPIVTGSRLSAKKLPHVSPERAGGDSRESTNASSDLISSPIEMKYMFATECSKPAATKAAMGGMTARILSVVVCAPYVSQIARQTSALQSIPSAIASTKPRLVLGPPVAG